MILLSKYIRNEGKKGIFNGQELMQALLAGYVYLYDINEVKKDYFLRSRNTVLWPWVKLDFLKMAASEWRWATPSTEIG